MQKMGLAIQFPQEENLKRKNGFLNLMVLLEINWVSNYRK